MDRQKIIFISIAVIIGGGLWWYFSSPAPTTPTSDGPKSTIGRFFPKAEPGPLPKDDTAGTAQKTDTGPQKTVVQQGPFRQLTNDPVAGFIFFKRSTPVSTAVAGETPKTIQEYVLRYVSRDNGYVYEITTEGSAVGITNILIPNIYEAIFTPDGKNVLERFLRSDNQTIGSYIVPIPEQNPDGTRTQREGIYLSDNITSVAVAPDGKKFAAVIPNGDSAGVFTFTVPENGSTTTIAKEIFRSPFTEWLITWPQQKAIFMQTKASSGSEGFLYNLDNITVKLRRMLGNINGLTTSVSPSKKYILYSQSTNVGINTSLYTVDTGTIIPIGHNILPEKCVWKSDENLICAGNDSIEDSSYPDSWYAGVTHFTDTIYAINTNTGSFDIPSGGQNTPYDITNLQVDESNYKLYFIDKKTGLLWRFQY